jgi:hypothetical protein
MTAKRKDTIKEDIAGKETKIWQKKKIKQMP